MIRAAKETIRASIEQVKYSILIQQILFNPAKLSH